MAQQIDSTLYLGVPSNVNVEVHVPSGQISPEGPDTAYVDPNETLNSAGNAKSLTVAGNVRFANPS